MTPSHRADLVERHVLSVPATVGAYGGMTLEESRTRAWAECIRAAEQWAADEDLEIDIRPFSSNDEWGVHFNVVVGQAATPREDGGLADHVAWNWSFRWRQWLDTFRIMDRPRLVALPGGNIISLHARRS